MIAPMNRFLVGLLISVFWVLMMATLAWRHLLPPRISGGEKLDVGQLTDDWQDVDEWMEVFIGGRPAGLAQASIHKDSDGFSAVSRARINLQGSSAASLKFQSVARLDQDFRLNSFWISALAPPLSLDVRGIVWDAKLLIVLDVSPGSTQRGFYPLEQPIVLMDTLRPLTSQKIDLTPGAVYRFSAFDPLWSGLAGEAVLKVVGPESIELNGEAVGVTKLETTLAGQKVLAWIDADHEVVRYEFMNNVVFQRISRSAGLKMEPSFGQEVEQPHFDVEQFTQSDQVMDLSQQSPMSMISQIFFGAVRPDNDSN